MTKGWTEERRKAQAERIRKNKPWLKSTGPKTAEGKRASSLNALKHGGRSPQMEACRKTVEDMLSLNSQFLKKVHQMVMAENQLSYFSSKLKTDSIKNKGLTPDLR